jgi:hypothetical protein
MSYEFIPRECQWIGKSHEHCTHAVVEGRSYCEDHLWQIYQKGTVLGKRQKDKVRAENTWNILSELELAYRDLVAEGEVDEA